MTVEEFLARGRKKKNEILKHYSEAVKEKDLGSHFEHEKEHQKVWKRCGITSEFRRDINGAVFTIDKDFDQKVQNFSKREVIEMLKEVCYEPYKTGRPLNECITDLIQYEILSRRQSNFPLRAEELEELKRKYERN